MTEITSESFPLQSSSSQRPCSKKLSCCCDERCGLVEKFAKPKPGCIFAVRFAVDFPAGLRKIFEFCVVRTEAGNPSTRHPLLSHAFLTNSPHGHVGSRAGDAPGGLVIPSRGEGITNCRDLPGDPHVGAKAKMTEMCYWRASIRRVMVRFSSLSERRNSSILLME